MFLESFFTPLHPFIHYKHWDIFYRCINHHLRHPAYLFHPLKCYARDVLFKFHLKFWNITIIGVPVRSLTSNWSNCSTKRDKCSMVFKILHHIHHFHHIFVKIGCQTLCIIGQGISLKIIVFIKAARSNQTKHILQQLVKMRENYFIKCVKVR